jgi:hypothetical protein
VSATPRSSPLGQLTEAASSLYEQALDRVLASPHRVTTAAEGKALLSSDRGGEAAADNVQRVAVLAVPVLRAMSRGARFSRVPWALVASTAISIGFTVRAGVRELQVLGSLVADRIERATGQPADPALVKKLALELYLAPGREPDLSDRGLGLARVVRRWLFRGVLGRETGKSAVKALEAAERLDVHGLVGKWAPPPAPGLPPVPGGR